jgi:hypothetical protein
VHFKWTELSAHRRIWWRRIKLQALITSFNLNSSRIAPPTGEKERMFKIVHVSRKRRFQTLAEGLKKMANVIISGAQGTHWSLYMQPESLNSSAGYSKIKDLILSSRDGDHHCALVDLPFISCSVKTRSSRFGSYCSMRSCLKSVVSISWSMPSIFCVVQPHRGGACSEQPSQHELLVTWATESKFCQTVEPSHSNMYYCPPWVLRM